MRIFVTGGTGLVGSRLIPRLRQRGDSVVLLSRRPVAAQERFGTDCTIVEGDPMRPGAWQDAVADCDAIVNLAGEGILNRRWNHTFMQLLRESRLQGTANVVQALARHPKTPTGSPKVLINASATGYYGPRGDEELTEDSPPGTDFLATLCADWEQAARAAEQHGVRITMIRVGVVLDKEGGALKKMLLPFKLGAGGPVGTGRQWLSWIHHADLVGMIVLALDNPTAIGPFNGTAPKPETSRDFAKALGRALGRPAFIPTPALALRLLLGKAAVLVTTGQRVVPHHALALGYQFQYPTVDMALREILSGSG